MKTPVTEIGRDVLLFACSALALFVLLFAYTWLRGEPLHVLHYTDETLHYGLIREYAQGRFPLDGPTYTSATTPLFHLSLAGVEALSGGNLWLLRALNLAITVAFAVVVFRDLRAQSSRLTAWIFGWVILASPYMGSRGFVLLTENYSYLWFWLAFRPFVTGRGETLTLRGAFVSAAFLTLAALTRQNWLWICPWMMLALAAPRLAPLLAARYPAFSGRGAPAPDGLPGPNGSQLVGAILASTRLAWPYLIPILVCLPFFAVWHGLVPGNWQGVNQATGPNVKAIVFTLVLLGLYVSVLAPSRLLAFLTPGRLAAAIVAAALLGLAGRLHHESLFTDSGFIWFVSDYFPTFAGANTLLVALAALGLLELARAAREGQWLYVAYIVLFALSFVSVRMCYQKYYEIPLLAAILWQYAGFRFRAIDRLGQLAWVGAGLLYLLSKIGKLEPPLLGG